MEAQKGLANINVKSRLKQIAALVITILISIAISSALQAQDFHKSKSKHFKSKYKAQIKYNSRACDILTKKRTEEPKQPMFAFLKSKPKYKPQAEVDAPSYQRTAKNSSNKNKTLLASAQ